MAYALIREYPYMGLKDKSSLDGLSRKNINHKTDVATCRGLRWTTFEMGQQ